MLNTTPYSISRFLPKICSFNAQATPAVDNPSKDLESNNLVILDPKDAVTPCPTKPNNTPQVYATEDGKISLLLSAPAIKNIEFPGGGASLVALPFALTQMNLDTVEHLAGCSGGGLIAALIASGATPTALCKKLEENSLATYLGTVPHFEVLYPNVTSLPAKSDLNFFRLAIHLGRMAIMTLFLGNWQRSAQGAIQLMDQISSQSVSQCLQETAIWDKCRAAHQARKINDTQMQRLLFLKDNVWFSEPSGAYTSRLAHMITFGDLELLQSIEPVKFKKLTLISSKITAPTDDKDPTTTSTTKTIFNALNSPDTPIAIAGRASMSIPFYFETLWYQGKSYADGAMTDRIPADILWNLDDPKDPVARAKAHAETMLLDFKSSTFGDTLTPILYTKPAPGPDKTVVSKAIEWFLGYPQYSSTVGQDNRRLYDAGPNTFVIDNGQVTAFDMAPNKKKFDAAAQAATQRMKQQLEMRKNEAYYLPFDTVVSAWNALDATQKEQVRAAGNPALDPDFKKLPARTQYAQSAFYVLAASSTQVLSTEASEINIPSDPNAHPMLNVKTRSAIILASLAASLSIFTTMHLAFAKSFSRFWPNAHKA